MCICKNYTIKKHNLINNNNNKIANNIRYNNSINDDVSISIMAHNSYSTDSYLKLLPITEHH